MTFGSMNKLTDLQKKMHLKKFFGLNFTNCLRYVFQLAPMSSGDQNNIFSTEGDRDQKMISRDFCNYAS